MEWINYAVPTDFLILLIERILHDISFKGNLPSFAISTYHISCFLGKQEGVSQDLTLVLYVKLMKWSLQAPQIQKHTFHIGRYIF